MRRLALVLAMTMGIGAMGVSSVQADPQMWDDTIWLVFRPPLYANDATNVHMSCGWHSSCKKELGYPWGTGLDWSAPGSTAKFRYTGVHELSAQGEYVAYAKSSQSASATCALVNVKIFSHNEDDPGGEILLGVLQHQHILQMDSDAEWAKSWYPLAAWKIYASPNGGSSNSFDVGHMVNDRERSGGGCPWSGFHVHREQASGDPVSTPDPPTTAGIWMRNTVIHNAADCGANACYADYSPGQWERKLTWTRQGLYGEICVELDCIPDIFKELP